MSRGLIVGIVLVAIIAVGFFVFKSDSYSGRKYSSGTIVAFGDSLTFGPEVDETGRYPAQLQTLLKEMGYTKFTVINMGRNGDTTADGLTRVDDVLEKHPDIVILVLGGNDFLRRQDVGQMKQNLDTIIGTLLGQNIMVILGGVRAVGPQVTAQYRGDFNEVYEDLAQKYGLLLVPDVLDGIRLHPSLNLSDFIHPNEKGYAVMVEENIWPVLREILE